MDVKLCMFCEHNDEKRKNDLGETRCTRFSTFVNPLSCCDYYQSRATACLQRLLKSMGEAGNNES
jgi:hypothetical protein